MRYLLIFIFNLFTASFLQGQSLAEKIALKACGHLDSIENFQILHDSIRPSLTAAMAIAHTEGTIEEKEILGNVEGIRGTFKTAYDLLPSYCYNVRRLILEDKTAKFYKTTDNHQANAHFEKGNAYMESGDYDNAIKEFKSAIKIDSQFIYALDHLAISYRRQEKFKTAIKYYEKSLKIFPEGYVALLNIAVAFSFLEDNTNSIKNYEQLKYLYPDDPEGYFGLAKMLLLAGDYDNALDNLFVAHRIYVESNSGYMEDSEQLMHIVYRQLKEENKLDLMKQKAAEHNVIIE